MSMILTLSVQLASAFAQSAHVAEGCSSPGGLESDVFPMADGLDKNVGQDQVSLVDNYKLTRHKAPRRLTSARARRRTAREEVK